MPNYIVSVQLTAYDILAVDAKSPEEARDKAQCALRNEQKYEQRQFRPLLASIHYIREDSEDSQIVWHRGKDPLERLVMGGAKAP